MHVAAVLKRKGSHVISIRPDQTIAEAVTLLSQNGIGAALVLDSTGGIRGIISERDIVRGVAEQGADALSQRVDALMTRDVHPCSPKNTVAEVMTVMTHRRHRHLERRRGIYAAGGHHGAGVYGRHEIRLPHY